MDTNIFQTVYQSLEKSTNTISRSVAERERLETRIKSGRYSQQAIQQELIPQLDALKKQIAADSAKAMQAAKDLVAQYRADVEKLNCLNPAELNDDIKLLQAGIPLLPRDINAILERNSDNRTMTQLALRYAQEHGITVDGQHIIGGDAERKTANALDQILQYYSRWIDKRNAKDVLRRFFNVE